MPRGKTIEPHVPKEDSDDEDDVVLPIDSLISTKKRQNNKRKQTDDVDDFVGALLGDDPHAVSKKRKARKKKTREALRKSQDATAAMAAEALALDQVKYDDDDVADLYAWDSSDDNVPAKHSSTVSKETMEDNEEEEKLRAERQRIMRLAIAAAEDSTSRVDDMPRNEDEWFAKLDEEAHESKTHGKRKQHEESSNSGNDEEEEEEDMATDVVGKHTPTPQHTVPQHKREAVGKFLAIDCEMVGAGFKGSRSMLARVSVVNYYGHVVLDTFVTPLEPVTDYRTWVSGIRKQDLDQGRPFKDVQTEVAELIKDRVLVGHAIKNDLRALMLTHPGPLVRDTSRYQGFRAMCSTKGPTFGLRKLAASLLNITIQESEHSSVTDAKTTMLLYRKVKDEWEKGLAPKRYKAKIKKIRTKERFDQLRAERKEVRDQQAVQQRKAHHNPYQLPRLKD
ncbi:3'-5' exonuclease [Coemansia sp. RSA 986]|nr:3'-5' exonuclease [Coemansia sp. RSA 1843]KAJ2088085.1 3'-5' exonuclease [Coemansia sp. RSA 986]